MMNNILESMEKMEFTSPFFQIILLSLILFYGCYPVISKKMKFLPMPVLMRIMYPMFQFSLLIFYLMERGSMIMSKTSSIGLLDFITEFIQRFASIFHISTLLVNDVLGIFLLLSLSRSYYISNRFNISAIKSWLINESFEFTKNNVRFVRERIYDETGKTRKDLERDLKNAERKITWTLPEKGRDHFELLQEMKDRTDIEDKNWTNGRVSGTVYCGETDHISLLNSVFALNSVSNPLHPDVWPSLSQYEGEICAMTANLLHGDKSVVGCVSSGGSESIFLAVKAHRSYFKYRSYPEIIASTTAHAALNKACEVLNIHLIQLDPDPITFRLRPNDVENHITSQTIMIYASAPNYPQGTIDPIEELGYIAKRHDIGLHVDACLGGFVLPFAKQSGFNIPKFDFEVDGVTSMSCDTHKFGYACKGTSVVLYKNKDIRHAQYFCFPEWTGGLYATPSIAGSRSGAMIACAWASLHAMGQNGYFVRAKKILETAKFIAERLPEELYLLGGSKPDAMIVCLASKTLNIYQVADGMKKRNWNLNSLQKPASIHLCVTVMTNKEEFVNDLRQVVSELAVQGLNNKSEEGGTAAIYGMAGSMPAGPVNEILKAYLDVTLAP